MSRDARQSGLALRKRANEFLQAKKPGQAVEGFTLALKEPDAASHKDHMAALHTGRATAYIALMGYDFALLDASAALQYNDKYYRAFEKRALARKGVLRFSLAAEDYLDAAACSSEPNYQRRMKAEAEAMMDEDEAEQKREQPDVFAIERDFEQARIELLTRGDDLSKNPTAQCILKAYDEIDNGWHEFFKSCDPDSDNPNLDGLMMVLEAAALEPRAAHFTCRSVPKDQLLAKFDAFMKRHGRLFNEKGVAPFIDLIPKVGLHGPNGAVNQVDRWLVLNLVHALREMTEGHFESAIGIFANILKAYVKLINAKLVSERLGRGPRLWDLIIFCAYRLLTVGRILGDQRMNDFVADLIENVRDESEGLDKESIAQSRKRCLARAYAVEAFFLRSTAQILEKTDFLNARKSLYWPNRALMGAACVKASKAIELLSNDDEEKAIAESLALCCEMESTSVVLREVLSTAARICCMRYQSSKFFGPSPTDEICREALSYMLGKLPDIFVGNGDPMYSRMPFRPKMLDDFLDLKLRPVGTVVIHDGASVNVIDYQDKAVLRYLEKQKGDLSVWNFQSLIYLEPYQSA